MGFSSAEAPKLPENNPNPPQMDKLNVEKVAMESEKMQSAREAEKNERKEDEAMAEQAIASLDNNKPDNISRTLSEWWSDTIETPDTAQKFRKNNPDLVPVCDDAAEEIQKMAKYLPRKKELYQAINQQTTQISQEKRIAANEYIAYMVQNWKSEEPGVNQRREAGEE